MKLEVIFFKEICLYRIFIGFTKMPCYQNVGYQDVLLPKCRLPKCPITEMSSYRNVLLRNVSYQNVHYQSVLYRNVWIPLEYICFNYGKLPHFCWMCKLFKIYEIILLYTELPLYYPKVWCYRIQMH
ncbi:hypothetical protein NP493_4g13040 [Ridgeia piscesae]|uniref:Uncharacterized protein n=1 Tax=Ridgeia piscesae TaxID=27915 RepID=A0AAD9PG79_RIDPI|nr:hypothetical protein NP493_4g13040 [Ridgeia piscesae]